MPPNILQKIYRAKKYSYYVASKALAENRFEMEREKLELLLSAYEQILLSSEKAYPSVKESMVKNPDFISFMAERRIYCETAEYTRLLFSNCLQTTELLSDLFANYEDSFIIQYLSQSHGFKNRDAALCFLRNIKNNKVVVKSDEVYEHNYEKLVDSKLKSAFTKFHNAAKKSQK